MYRYTRSDVHVFVGISIKDKVYIKVKIERMVAAVVVMTTGLGSHARSRRRAAVLLPRWWVEGAEKVGRPG